MRRRAWIGAVVLVLLAGGWAAGKEPTCDQPEPPCFLRRIGPVGGWCPYGGGLLG